MHRFFLSPEFLLQTTAQLDSEESHHCVTVLRHAAGEKIVVFDGRGNEATAVIENAEKHAVTVRILHHSKTPALRCQITLGQAVPRRKIMDLIVQKAVELGATRIAPLISARTVVQIDPVEAADKSKKWKAVALEACKQCGRNWLPDVEMPLTLKTFFESAKASKLMLIASLQPDARRLKTVLAEYQQQAGGLPDSVTILVGPEGDFTPAELALAKSHGCFPITLGPIVLRTETASLYSLSVLGYELF